MSGSSNLFDLSRGGSKKPPEKRKQALPKATSYSTSENIYETLKKMQERHIDITKKLEEAFQKSGIDPQELSKYCENPDNFTSSQWTQFLQRKEAIELEVTGLSKDSFKEKKDLKEKVKISKERRGKTLGSRKHWLDMH